MADADFPPPIRLMNFVSQDQLDEAKKTRGPRIEDGTAQRDRPLFEILKENKEKKDAEFNERFKHRPPKALDEDETEFLDKLEMSKREYERQLADDEAQQLRSFQEAVAAQSAILHEQKETVVVPKIQEQKATGKKNTQQRSSGVLIKVKPHAKKKKMDQQANTGEKRSGSDRANNDIRDESQVPSSSIDTDPKEKPLGWDTGANNEVRDEFHVVAAGGLVSYSDESDDD